MGYARKGAPKLELLPEGRGIVLVEFGADDPDHARSSRAATHGSVKASARCAEYPSLHAGRSAPCLATARVRAAGSRLCAGSGAAMGRMG